MFPSVPIGENLISSNLFTIGSSDFQPGSYIFNITFMLMCAPLLSYQPPSSSLASPYHPGPEFLRYVR